MVTEKMALCNRVGKCWGHTESGFCYALLKSTALKKNCSRQYIGHTKMSNCVSCSYQHWNVCSVLLSLALRLDYSLYLHSSEIRQRFRQYWYVESSVHFIGFFFFDNFVTLHLLWSFNFFLQASKIYMFAIPVLGILHGIDCKVSQQKPTKEDAFPHSIFWFLM